MEGAFFRHIFAYDENVTEKEDNVPLRPIRLRSEPALSVVEWVNSGEKAM